jgi:hypothetical protein
VENAAIHFELHIEATINPPGSSDVGDRGFIMVLLRKM